jgi:hypothetical protein
MTTKWISLAGLALLGACASDLKPSSSGFTPKDGGIDMGAVWSTPVGDATDTFVDASWDTQWIYFDFETGMKVIPANPMTDKTWDLGFQRFKIKSNGGVSGGAGIEVALLPSTTLEMVTQAPATGWALDQVDGPDGNPDPDVVFNQGATWFDYDVDAHILSARKQVYAVMTGAGNYYGVQMLRYYDDAGTAGYMTFRWKKLLPPAGTRVAATIDGGAPGDAGDAGAQVD